MLFKSIYEKLIAVGLVFAAALFAYQAVSIGNAPGADKATELWTSITVACLSALGGFYVLLFERVSKRDEHDAELRKVFIEGFAQRYFEQLIEPRMKSLENKAHAVDKFVEMEYEEEARKRARREEALIGLSDAVAKSTKAFATLTKFRPSTDGVAEPLLGALTQALNTREGFRRARDELVKIRAIRSDHIEVLRDYGRLLSTIIVEIRQKPDTGGQEDYLDTMKKYSARLSELDTDIDRRLRLFLSPKHKKALAPDDVESEDHDSRPVRT